MARGWILVVLVMAGAVLSGAVVTVAV